MLTFDKALTRSELARELAVDRGTVWHWQRRGLIPAPERVSGNKSLFSPAAQMAAAALAESAR